MTDSLQKIFGSASRLKLLRLFLFNPQHSFTLADAVARAQVDQKEARTEIAQLVASGLIKKTSRNKIAHYEVSGDFPYLLALQNLLLNVTSRGEEVRERLKSVGNLKLVVIAGVFMGEWDASLDLLVVGEKIRERVFKNQIKKLEAEIGKEVRFALFSTQDFFYRLNMSDRLLRDIFDFSHRIVLDKLDIGLK